MIEIDSGVKLRDIESALHKIFQASVEEVKIPRDFLQKKIGAMHDAARLQLMVTWARGSAAQYINFDHQVNLENTLEEYGRSAAGVTALRLAQGVRAGNKTLSRREALLPAAKWIELADQEKYAEIIKGRSIELISVSGAKLQYPRPIFEERHSNSVKRKVAMERTFSKIFSEINKRHDEVPNGLISALSLFAHELFLNTQEHAIYDCLFRPLGAHVEGLSISWSQLQEDDVGDDFSGHPELKDFWNRESVFTGDVNRKPSLRCVQVSFFDTGPGFASRVLNKPISAITEEEEERALNICFQKNTTTKRQVGAGMGFVVVLNTLRDLGGMIRIRTGRKCIFNSFDFGDGSKNIFDFKNWSNEKLAPVEGAVISILIPLRK